MNQIELLSPAKDLECGIAAINCGADAVYIGARKFGARSAASNDHLNIEKLASYAHQYKAKIYITLNTILFDHELDEARKIAYEVYDAGADALIIQDMGLLEIDMPPLPLIASTQMNNRDRQKIKFLEDTGFKRAILARELTLAEIKEIRAHTKLELEFFIHGALCVSYSGRCYFSQAVCGRSGNRGVCSQPCRMFYNLMDEKGNIIGREKYFLSLKDLNLSDSIEPLLDAGITSFKIEGRLKDESYIKNIVSYYRKRFDDILDKKGLARSSTGESRINFEPGPYKTFNRGYTDHFINGRKKGIISLHTQKSIGEYIGDVKEKVNDYFIINYDDADKKMLHNGDGICFFNDQNVLCGMAASKVENRKIYPFDNRWISEGYKIYRNHDHAFIQLLKGGKIERKIAVEIKCAETDDGLKLEALDEDGIQAELIVKMDKKTAENKEAAVQTLDRNMTKLGDTIYYCRKLTVNVKTPLFMPVKMINSMRRELILKLEEAGIKAYRRETAPIVKNTVPYPEKELDYTYNVLNQKAREFYFRHGVKKIDDAAESGLDLKGKKIMTSRYCLKYELGECEKENTGLSKQRKLYLTDGRNKYALKFNCGRCEMEIYLE